MATPAVNGHFSCKFKGARLKLNRQPIRRLVCHIRLGCPRAVDVCRQRYPGSIDISAAYTVACHLYR